MVSLFSERLLLREFVEEDFNSVHLYAVDPEVVRFMSWGPNTESDTRNFIDQAISYQKELPRTKFELAVVLKREGILVGGCGIRISKFNSKEAEVYRKGDNVLISARGFYFPSGGAEILAQNFELLNKIISAIRQFPGSRLEISGHTDAIGDEDTNLPLSRKRAENIAKFLVEVGNIKSDNITTRGYGESRPVASNETPEGRAKNRRIEMMIINN